MELIYADSEGTWPRAILRLLARGAKANADFQLMRARIDRAAESNVTLRVNPPGNPHSAAWEDVLKATDEALVGHYLAGFHATRLTEAEREDIASIGMRVLRPALFERRLEGVAGALSDDVLASLRTRNRVGDGNRSGKAWFCFTRALLRDEGGIGRLFRSWGGEALYSCHENDPATGPALMALGKPCIVVARIPVAGIETFMSVGQRLVNAWCARRCIGTEHRVDFEGYVRADVAADDIVQIVTLDDSEFRSLTKHDAWDAPLS